MKLPVYLTKRCSCKLVNAYNGTNIRHLRNGILFRKNNRWMAFRRELSIIPDFNNTRKPPWRIVYFGSDDFSIPSLKMLCREMKAGHLINRLSVVTSLKGRRNPVRDLAMENEVSTFDWPLHICLADYDLGLVASFGHLIPEHVIGSFPLGMLNVHASLLPRWRGAAPIIYALLNGDSQTGITIMEIKPHKFDVGNIICQESCPITPTDTAPALKSRLANLGADVLLETLKDLPGCLYKSKPQPESGITYAPRVTSSLARVNWQAMDSVQVYNLHRALAGLFSLTTMWHGLPIKLLEPTLTELKGDEGRTNNSWLLNLPGNVELDHSGNVLHVLCGDNRWIGFKAVGVSRKKPMSPRDFYNGYVSKRSATERLFS